MNSELELAKRIQKVVDTFGRKAEAARRREAGVVERCRGCGADVVSKGPGRPRIWCDECRKPGGEFDAARRRYNGAYYARQRRLSAEERARGMR